MTLHSPADLQLISATMLLESDPAAAARRAGEILANHPAHPEATLLLATACRRLGDSRQASEVLESLSAEYRNLPLIQLELGRAYAGAGRSELAAQVFRRAVELDGDLADAWRELSGQLFAAGDTQGGDAAYGHYMRLSPEPPELKDANLALAENRVEAAEAMLQRRLQEAPHDVFALRMLGEIANRREDFALAESRLTTCLALAPGYGAARFDLANMLHLQQRDSEVLPLVDRLLATEPNNLDYLSLKAQAQRRLNRGSEAVAVMERALELYPSEPRAWLSYGHLLREMGQQARTVEMYRRAIELHPQCGQAYNSLANLKTFRFTTAEIMSMQEQVAHATLQNSERIHFEFALGQALETDGQYRESFEHYAKANQMQRQLVSHDASVITADVKRAKGLFTREFFQQRRGWGSLRRDPIFIVGLPRSGSTLLEQMLASHSQVEGTRELADMLAIAEATTSERNARAPYPESLSTIGKEEVEALAAQYLSRTQVHRPLAKPRFVDKMLANFAHLGLIHLLFPEAAIIDTRRHPLGCGFSCYKQLFARGFGYTYDLVDFARYYRDYAELLEHFDSVLPRRVHRVHYEQLVADPETELRKLLDYCGLPFEQQCLQFYENPRAVQTISSEQVRRPIYTQSVDQWRHYEPWLTPMRQAMGELIERYPLPQPAAR